MVRSCCLSIRARRPPLVETPVLPAGAFSPGLNLARERPCENGSASELFSAVPWLRLRLTAESPPALEQPPELKERELSLICVVGAGMLTTWRLRVTVLLSLGRFAFEIDVDV